MSEPIAWRPEPPGAGKTVLGEFCAYCGEADFWALQKRSVADVEWFTEKMLEFFRIRFEPPYEQLLDVSEGVEWARWCVGGGLNIGALCMEGKDAKQPAVVWEGEEGGTRSWSYRGLEHSVSRCAAGLRDLGIGKGDAVGVHLPMMPETVAVMVALARMGAVAVPLFTGYGAGAIELRMNDVGAKAIFTCNAFPRRGKTVRAKETVDEAAGRCPTVRNVIMVQRLDGVEAPMEAGRDLTWEELCGRGRRSEAEPTMAEDPLLIIYSSGTTGQPKGIAHSHCGFPVKSAADMAFGFNVRQGTRIGWLTDIGWMMGPWLIYGTLLLGGTIALYDGAPDYPHGGRLWSFIERQGVEVMGVSPTLIRALAAGGDEIVKGYDFSRLRAFGSTGEPWNPEPWRWLFEVVGRGQVPIINYSGGTEISGGILCNNPMLELKSCGFSAPCLGMDADVVNEAGEPVRGEVGELVVRKPWLGMARGFYGDRERYLETYWSMFPGIWRHGDFARIDEDGHWFIEGRSDDTIKIAGKRVGPAEVESVLVSHERVIEAAAIGAPDALKGNVIVVFVVAAGAGDEELAVELTDLVGEELGKPLRPAAVHFVSAIPKTRNGKVMRRLIRAAWQGQEPGDLMALENPAAVEEIRRLAEV